MTRRERQALRERAEKRIVCMGMGGQEAFVNHSDMILSRKSVLELLDEREQILTRVRAMLMWVPKDNANRKWFEELDT